MHEHASSCALNAVGAGLVHGLTRGDVVLDLLVGELVERHVGHIDKGQAFGGMDLGMGVTYRDPGSSQMGKKESIEDTARVLGRMYDGIEFRGFAQRCV